LGLALGPPDGGWWRYLTRPARPEFKQEDGTRTFAFSELMVGQDFAGRHLAHALHDALLADRKEQRAVLLVKPDNATACRAYLRWGWRKAAELRSNWPDSPLFDVLVLPLPIGQEPCRVRPGSAAQRSGGLRGARTVLQRLVKRCQATVVKGKRHAAHQRKSGHYVAGRNRIPFGPDGRNGSHL